MPVLSIQKLNISADDRVLLKNINLSVSHGNKIGLIGPNGSGKTSLLSAIVNNHESVKIEGSIHYVPQLDFDLLNKDIPVYQYINEKFEEWWEVIEVFKSLFNGKELEPEQSLNTLSGGELTKINLAVAYLVNADLLLLDEPTNHLDKTSLNALIKILKAYAKSFIVVSHDTGFLDKVVNTIWAIENKSINTYGGTYSEYKQQKVLKEHALLRDYEAKKKELKKINSAIQKENKRAGRSIGMNNKLKHDRSMPAILRGGLKNAATQSAGQIKKQLAKQQDKLIEETKSLKPAASKKSFLDITSGKGKQKVIDLNNAQVLLNNQKFLTVDNFDVSYGDRIVIEGNNGSGKTGFVKAILGIDQNLKLQGDIYISKAVNTAYVSQKYEIVNPQISLIENIKSINPGLPYQEICRVLGNFLFLTEDDIKKPAAALSGGETARLAFAMVTTGNIDLLILDEPTNNLDIQTIDTIAEALEAFTGALIVISHNEGFSNRLGINKIYTIKDRTLIS